MTTHPNKSLGQHWLRDEAALRAICEFAGVKTDDVVLEIGPGLGTLTEVLLAHGARVHAVEFDAQLAAKLKTDVHNPRLAVEHADILQFDFTQLPPGYKVVANIPYYITSAIVRRLLESTNPPASATLLVQKEVAERLAAVPGRMSLMSVAAQFYANVSPGFVVPAAMFTPAPKVDSQVIRLDYTGPKFTDVDRRIFFRIVKAGFAERRKKLRSSLAGGLQVSKTEADAWMQRAGIPVQARAQELSLEQWHRLALAAQI